MDILPAMRPKNKRQAISLSKRLEVINYSNEHPEISQQNLANFFGLERSTVSKIIQQKEKYLNLCNNSQALTTLRLKSALFPYLDNAVYQWFVYARKKHLSITHNIID